jgi:rhodanese-related sulfurtransferase
MFWNTKRQTPLMTPEELASAMKDGTPLIIVDVRDEKEYQAGHLPGAVHIPFDELATRAAELNTEAPTVFY